MLTKIWMIFYSDERRIIILLFFLILTSSLLEISGLILVIPYVNLMVDEAKYLEYTQQIPLLKDWLSITDDYKVSASILFALFYVAKNSMLTSLIFVQQNLIRRVKTGIVNRMFDRYMSKPYVFHLNTRSSDLVRSITYDAPLFIDSVLMQGAMLVSELLLFLGVLIALVVQSPLTLVVMFVTVTPVVTIYLITKRRLFLWGRVMQQRQSGVIKDLQEGIGGIKDAIILGVEDFFKDNFRQNIHYLVTVKRNSDVTLLAPRNIIEAAMMVSMAGAFLWIDTAGGLVENIATVVFLSIVIVRLLPMSNRILASVSAIKASSPSIDVVLKAAKPDEMEDDKIEKEILARKSQKPFEKLTVDKLTFSYMENQVIVNHVDFEVKRGETLGIVGGSGSGKTTLVDLMLGLLAPDSGEIRCNGTLINQNMRGWQQRIGYVQQVIFLMDATIAENIAYGVHPEAIDYKRIEKVMCLAKLDKWLESLPDGLKTMVGETGVRISGGQRQRIGIARALYHNPEILVLDEATSALDNRTEKEVMDDVYSMHEDRTIIMIAHRLDTIKKCDRVLVLDDGKIVGEGSYDELLRSNQVFQEISMHVKESHSSLGDNNETR